MQPSPFFKQQNAKEKQKVCEYLEKSVDTLVDNNFSKLRDILVEKGLTEEEAHEVLEESKQEVKERTVKKFLEKVGEDKPEVKITNS